LLKHALSQGVSCILKKNFADKGVMAGWLVMSYGTSYSLAIIQDYVKKLRSVFFVMEV